MENKALQAKRIFWRVIRYRFLTGLSEVPKFWTLSTETSWLGLYRYLLSFPNEIIAQKGLIFCKASFG